MRIEEGPIRRITFERPDSYNALTAEVARELAAAIEASNPDDHDAVVVTGDGDSFCAGGDIDAMAERDETARESFERVQETVGSLAEALLTAPVPVVAKVNGDAVGAGMTLVANTDFAIAADDARFGATFVNVGLIPDMGGATILPRVLGLRKTKELAFTGSLLGAEEAADLDLVNETVPGEDLDERVEDLLETLAEQPTETIGLAKEAIHDNLGAGWRAGLEREAQTQTMAYQTDAHETGVEAFLDGRTPEFD